MVAPDYLEHAKSPISLYISVAPSLISIIISVIINTLHRIGRQQLILSCTQLPISSARKRQQVLHTRGEHTLYVLCVMLLHTCAAPGACFCAIILVPASRPGRLCCTRHVRIRHPHNQNGLMKNHSLDVTASQRKLQSSDRTYLLQEAADGPFLL